jgi:peptidylglycine monooxygenase
MPRTELVVALGDRLYAVERPWGELPAGMQLAFVSQVAVDSEGYVYLCQRHDPPVVVFDPEGGYARSWGSDVIADAHGIAATPDNRIVVVDRDAHQLLFFDTGGRLMWTLGERHRPRLQAPFNHPCDVAVAPDGEIYVADGYGNSCVHRFSADGRLLATWGEPGDGPGQFSTPHAVWVDGYDSVLVADRENNRIQVFSRDGTFQEEWPDHYHPMDIYVAVDGMVLVTDQIPRLSMLASDGSLAGRCRPVAYGAHGIWGDADGNIFLAEANPMNRITRLVPL